MADHSMALPDLESVNQEMSAVRKRFNYKTGAEHTVYLTWRDFVRCW